MCSPAVSADAGDLAQLPLDNDQVGDDLERVKAEIDKAVAAVGQLEMRIKQDVEPRSSSSRAEQISRVLDYGLQHLLQNIRSALKTVPPDAS